MQISTEFKGMFSYSIVPIIVFILLLIITFVLLKIKLPQSNNKNIQVVQPNKADRNAIRQKYLNLIEQLRNEVNKGLNSRIAYQRLSKIIRNFIYEMTNIKVQYCTLSDIKAINMPILYELVQEYYDPEFAKDSLGNILESIDKTKKVILKWN